MQAHRVMKTLDFYFDVVSPYAYLAFHKLPGALQGLSHQVRYVPVLFAGLLKHHGQLGPAEVAPKRDWTYRQVAWLAHETGVALDMPAAHPFNPLPVLRLMLACAPDGRVNRLIAEQALTHVWQGGEDPNAPQRLAALQTRLAAHLSQLGGAPEAPDGDAVKTRLRTNTEAAIARGVFGVPTVAVDDKLFWGQDALPMLRAYLEGDRWFDVAWRGVVTVPVGARRV